MKYSLLICLVVLSGCGFHTSPKQITVVNAKGEIETSFACSGYIRVSSESWVNSTYKVTFTDAENLDHDLYGLKEVDVSDIPSTMSAPMYGFQYEHFLGERYMDKPDGTPGDLIKEGDIVSKGDNQARLVNGKWTPVKIPNPACKPNN